jgi:hypothetical protein
MISQRRKKYVKLILRNLKLNTGLIQLTQRHTCFYLRHVLELGPLRNVRIRNTKVLKKNYLSSVIVGFIILEIPE